ncbi:MAG TPA: TIGR04283 family arsenosugar biosynthesis glycosyltransferase [Phycisphaerae bacterium]|nr:TIGR04283 family arsenosugar biosynthesis glycosyltransferase [Phycisphaerae bacterium]
MREHATIAVVIPALNEAEAIGKVIVAIPDWVDDIVVVDNGSTDRTADVARAAGARVVQQPQRGYGSACLAGIASLHSADVVVFLDGDFSDSPQEMPQLVDPIVVGQADMVIGSRVLGRREPGALTIQQELGNSLACLLIRLFWRVRYTDLGPFRAIRHAALRRLAMADRSYGWTVEMQTKAARQKLAVHEVPVSYRRRIGISKVSGTMKGVLGAGSKILWTILAAAIKSWLCPAGRHVRDRLIVFTRYPERGRTKTRLIPTLGPDGAAELHKRMTEHAVSWARRLVRAGHVDLEIRFEGGSAARITQWLGHDLTCTPQPRGDLGRRMFQAFCRTSDEGVNRVVIIGTDCPALDGRLTLQAFESLDRSDLVLGPAYDGGYYLIGLRRPVRSVFEDMPWGTDRVLSETLRKADKLRLKVALLRQLPDLDRPEDLPHWQRVSASHAALQPPRRISVVIPTLNEASNIDGALSSIRRASGVEVIVVDAHSHDGTAALARSRGARVVTCRPGRGRQMNLGASVASGDILLFLHADTRLPDGFDRHVRRLLAAPNAVAGAFELAIDGSQPSLRVIERLANWRSRRLCMPYGDQAIFIHADAFRRVGGYPDLPVMEDYELVRRVRSLGRIVIARAAATTSARRWLALGVWRTTLLNQITIMLYNIGVSPARFAHRHPSA